MNRRELLNAAISRFGPQTAIVEMPGEGVSIRRFTGRWKLREDASGHKFAFEGPDNIIYRCNSLQELQVFLKTNV